MAGDGVSRKNLRVSFPVPDASRDHAMQLGRARRMQQLGMLAAGIVHDLGNLLAVVAGQVDQARNLLGERRTPYKELRLIDEAIGQSRALIELLLDHADTRATVHVPVNLSRLVVEASELVRPMFSDAVEFTVAVPAFPVLWVDGSARQLKRVILNLADNARKAMPEGGRFTIALSVCSTRWTPETSRHGVTAKLVVADTGKGMPALLGPKLSAPFFRTERPGQGAGLGLWLVREIVSEHSGHLDVDWQPKHGASVSVSLPARTSCRIARAAEEPPLEKLGGGSGARGSERARNMARLLGVGTSQC